jgi:ethanolamine-phosphate cytidylyltransferase
MKDLIFLETYLKLKESKIFEDPDFEKYAHLKLEKSEDQDINKSLIIKEHLLTEFNEFKQRGGELPKKKIRGLVEGVFDMTHFGHFNMLRQASKICDEVIVALNSDESVKLAKGPTVMNEQERKKIVEGCKFVKEVYIDPKYYLEVEDLDKYKVDFIIHGDDIVYDENGENNYTKFEKLNKFRLCKRTTGISTTDIVSKLLSLKVPLFKKNLIMQKKNKFYHSMNNFQHFKPEFSIQEGKKVVYISGSFDLLTPENVDVLEKARNLGDYLVVGLFSDELIRNEKGEDFPILDMNGRALNLFSLKFVDDLIFEAPAQITQKFINDNKIDLVVKADIDYLKQSIEDLYQNIDPSIVKEIKHDFHFNFDTFTERLTSNELFYEESIMKKMDKLKDYYKNEKAVIN